MTFKTIDTIHYLGKAPILSDCSVQDLSRLIPFISEHHFKPNETVFQAGLAANKLYLVIQGTVRLLSGERIVDDVSQGFLGEEAAIDYKKYSNCSITTGGGLRGAQCRRQRETKRSGEQRRSGTKAIGNQGDGVASLTLHLL